MKRTDRKEIAVLLWEIFTDMELPLLKKLPKDTLIEIVTEAMLDPTYRYGVSRGLVYEQDGEIAGVIYGYPAEDEPMLDEAFQQILKAHGFNSDEKLFVDREAFANEWYIDSIVVNHSFRGLGIGTKLMDAMCAHVTSIGHTVVGLNVDIANPKAKKLYASLGFKEAGIVTISGHQYEHMSKNLLNEYVETK